MGCGRASQGGGLYGLPVLTTATPSKDLAAGELDFSGGEIMGTLLSLDVGVPLVVVGGIHARRFVPLYLLQCARFSIFKMAPSPLVRPLSVGPS